MQNNDNNTTIPPNGNINMAANSGTSTIIPATIASTAAAAASCSSSSCTSWMYRFVRKNGYVTLLILSAMAGIIGAVHGMYTKLDSRIDSLTTVEITDQINNTETFNDLSVEIHNLSDVSNEIASINADISQQAKELASLKRMIDFQLNTTVQQLNATVEAVQQTVDEKVQQVNENVSSQNSLMAYQFAGTFAILGSLISFWHMAAHLRKMNEPFVQRKIIAILWMIPIYSVSSWLGLVFVEASAILSIFKDIYEAYAIYTFLSFLIAILGRGDREAVITVLAQHEEHLKPPLRFLSWCRKKVEYASVRHKAEAVLDQCQFFTLQFVLLRPITTIIIVIADDVHESSWDPRYPQFYVIMVVNISIFFAFTGLVRFYHVVKNDLNWCHPFSKFLCIKGVVFMTFWQGIIISFIAHAVYNNDANKDGYDDSSPTEWSKQAQSFLICLEMFLFAIVHCFVFPTEEWEKGYQQRERLKIKANFGDSLALRDFVKDVKLVMRSRNKGRRRKGKRRQMQKLPQRDYDDSMDVSDSGGSVESWARNGHGNGNGNGNGNGASLTMADDDDLDINWSNGWSRIEQYLEIVDEEGMATMGRGNKHIETNTNMNMNTNTKEKPAGGHSNGQGYRRDGVGNGMIEMQSRSSGGTCTDATAAVGSIDENLASFRTNDEHDLCLAIEEEGVGSKSIQQNQTDQPSSLKDDGIGGGTNGNGNGNSDGRDDNDDDDDGPPQMEIV